MYKCKRFAIALFFVMATFFLPSSAHAFPDCVNCAVPTNLTVTNVSNTTVNISWTPGSSCGNFEVTIRDNNNNFSATYPVTGTTYQFTNLSPLSSYTICVAMVSTDLVSCQTACIDVRTTGEAVGCSNCDPPIAITFSNITNTSATVNWFPANSNCDDFYVYLEDVVNGTYQKFVAINTTSYTFTNLAPGRPYRVMIAVISTQQLDCITTEAEFETTHDGLPCFDCNPPLSISVTQITSTSAYVSWVPGSQCYDFDVWVYDNNTWQTFSTTNTFLTLNNLNPSTTYTVSVANKHYGYPPLSCLGNSTDFTTLHCANFNQSFSFYNYDIGFSDNNNTVALIPYSTGTPPGTPTPASYMFSSGTYSLAKNTWHQFSWTDYQFPNTPGGTRYISVWLDYNNDGVFQNSERVTHAWLPNHPANPSSIYNGVGYSVGSNCSPCSFTTPNQTLYNIRGRCITSYNQDPGPCDNFSDGQVLDFTISIQ